MCVNCLAPCLYLLHITIIITVAFAAVDINTAQLDKKLLGPWDHICDCSCSPDVTQECNKYSNEGFPESEK